MPQLTPSSTNLPAVSPAPVTGGLAGSTVQWGVAPLFDSANRQLLFEDSNELILGNEATTLSQRIVACLTTTRLRWPIHTQLFGCDLELIIGKHYPPEIVTSMVEEFVRAAVVDSRIFRLSDFKVDIQGKFVNVTFTMTTIVGYKSQFTAKWSV